MNTLSRAITARFFTTPDQYTALRRHWSALVNSPRKHELRAEHHLLYLALLGKDWRRAFTPISNANKLANGGFEDWKLFDASFTVQNPTAKYADKLPEVWLRQPTEVVQATRDQLIKGGPRTDSLLKPFAGLVSLEMLLSLRAYLPDAFQYRSNRAAFVGGIFPFDAYVVPAEVQGG